MQTIFVLISKLLIYILTPYLNRSYLFGLWLNVPVNWLTAKGMLRGSVNLTTLFPGQALLADDNKFGFIVMDGNGALLYPLFRKKNRVY